MNRKKHFCKEGVLLDEFLHKLYKSKNYNEKSFHCMCLRDILSDVKSNIIKQFTSYIEI